MINIQVLDENFISWTCNNNKDITYILCKMFLSFFNNGGEVMVKTVSLEII